VAEPLVSVGLRFFNNEKTLGRAIESILNQTYQNWELILHDDGSRDHSLEVARGFQDPRIKLFTEGVNRHRSVRANQSLKLARGKYYAVIDGDDLAYPRRLERQVVYLERHPDIDLVGAWVIVFKGDGMPLGKRTPPQTHSAICARPFAGIPIAHPTFLGRLKWFQQYCYDEAMQRVEDQDLLLRSYRFSCFANLPEILLGYREDRLNIKKILRGRQIFVNSLLREFRRQQRPALAIRAVVEQGMKGAIDILAVNSGLRYRLLRHRAQSITQAEREEWRRVWQSVNGIEMR
jgi:glycosyltransferase involved in cell wall biosynthesis